MNPTLVRGPQGRLNEFNRLLDEFLAGVR